MGKYIDKELLLEMVSKAVDQVEEFVDNASPELVKIVQEKIQQGVESGTLDKDDLPSYTEAIAGTGLMHIAMNLKRTGRMFLADPNVKRYIKEHDGQFEIVSQPVSFTETEISKNAQTGIKQMERFLSGIITAEGNEPNNPPEDLPEPDITL